MRLRTSSGARRSINWSNGELADELFGGHQLTMCNANCPVHPRGSLRYPNTVSDDAAMQTCVGRDIHILPQHAFVGTRRKAKARVQVVGWRAYVEEFGVGDERTHAPAAF